MLTHGKSPLLSDLMLPERIIQEDWKQKIHHSQIHQLASKVGQKGKISKVITFSIYKGQAQFLPEDR